MNTVFGAVAAAIGLLAAPAPAHASDPGDAPVVSAAEQATKLALARKFIALLQAEEMTEAMVQMAVDLAPEGEAFGEDSGISDAFVADMMAEMMEDMVARLFDAMAPIYADIFTLEELEALVDFYQSDVGQSMVLKSYEAAPRIMAVVEDMMPSLMADMAESLCDEMACTAEERREIKAGIAAGAAF